MLAGSTFCYKLGAKATASCVVLKSAALLPEKLAALLHLEQDMGAGLADALQNSMHCLQVANVENWQLQLDVACRHHDAGLDK